jgi:hypothetical protein
MEVVVVAQDLQVPEHINMFLMVAEEEHQLVEVVQEFQADVVATDKFLLVIDRYK